MYDGDNILAEFDGGNQLLATYTHSPLMPDDVLSSRVTTMGALAGIAPTAGTVYFLKDMLGSVTDLISATGDILQRFEYSAFGKILSVKDGTGADVTANAPYRPQFSFTGRELDEESGLYYYRARYYDASTGRFLQRDPHPGKIETPITHLNKYIYVANLPTLLTDPKGKFVHIVIGALIGAAVGAVIGAIDAIVNGGNFFESVLRGAIGGALFGAAFAINPAAAALSLGVSIAKAGSRDGNFLQNFNNNLIQDGAFAAVGASLASTFEGIALTEHLPGQMFAVSTEGFYGIGVALGVAYTAGSLINTACDPEYGGAYRSDFCSISRTVNGN